MTEYKFESNLFKKLQESRKEIATQYGNDVLERIMLETCPPSLPKRYENLVLQKRFNERMNLWREL